jgi:molybdopterin-containing oxidoreductase family iron-sulfur binding subunit
MRRTDEATTGEAAQAQAQEPPPAQVQESPQAPPPPPPEDARFARGARALWRSIEETRRSDDFLEALHREFPPGITDAPGALYRREFLKLMGASMALGGLTGCGSPEREAIVPYVKQPEGVVLGKAESYATAALVSGYATGILVTSHAGRPTKVEGNPDHPASLGATDAFAQASVLSLYDPDRSQVVWSEGRIRTWQELAGILKGAMNAQKSLGGAGLRILTETVTSPTLAALMADLLREMPQARWIAYEPFNLDQVRAGARLAFGQPLSAHLRLEHADVVVALDSDFLGTGPGAVRHARELTARRAAPGEQAHPATPSTMNRLYAIEGSPSITGAFADHRLAVAPGRVATCVRALATRLGLDLGPAAVEVSSLPAEQRAWISAAADDLRRDPATGTARPPGTTLVVTGEAQPPAVHALVHAINAHLGNLGRTVILTDPVEQEPPTPAAIRPPASQVEALGQLAAELSSGKVDVLIVLGGNPAYTAPADLGFEAKVRAARLSIHFGLHRDETAEACHWHVPSSHALESWGDARAFEGTVTLLQPLLEPLYGTRTDLEVVGALLGRTESAQELVKQHWKRRHGETGFDDFWEKALHDGVVHGTAAGIRSVAPAPGAARESSEALARESAAALARAGAGAAAPAPLEVVFRPDPTVWDGRFANNGWLQELPKPLTKLTWDNAALVGPAEAARLEVQTGDMVTLAVGGRSIDAPVFITPGHAAGAVTVHLGYGRTRAGRIGTGAGFDGYRLRSSGAPWFEPGLVVSPAGGTLALATTQRHWNIEGRDLVRVRTPAELAGERHGGHAEQGAGHEGGGEGGGGEHDESRPGARPHTMYPDAPASTYAWGMSVDLGRCTGCNACVVACQAENNVPVVGKDQVLRGRAMHWLRIDRYYEGEVADPRMVHHQPVMCMHCEHAPCEVVCPANATVHSEEGLNEMVYNRCVGTRYCSNNCPYKVRRFNYFQFSDTTSPTLKMLANPEVTVRSRGVMEKCTYCVQRIDAARVDAKIRGERIRDGEVRTACQAACPTQAIVFGDVNDPRSGVSRDRARPHAYGMLTELNTRPRTTYLAKLVNPSPAIASAGAGGAAAEAHGGASGAAPGAPGEQAH